MESAGIGCAVYAIDHRGHGRSAGRRVYVNKFDDYLSDVRTFLKMEREKSPGLPLFLFGHSMGGAIALNTVGQNIGSDV